MFSDKEGETAVKAARNIIEAKVKGDKYPNIDYPEKFDEKMGVFVTLNKYPSENLRGCIGYPEPIFSLKKALKKAAESATNDPRFPPLGEDELDGIVVEVTLLTPPKEIEYQDPDELIKEVTCGVDGLVISKGHYKGLLLPQVPVEQGWDEDQFLSHTCRKAGLGPNTWKKGGCTVEKFQGEIFAEEEPSGNIIKKELN
ncbi:MAG: TIGR00296 family protein [Candidatus Saliniplasma sp.]